MPETVRNCLRNLFKYNNLEVIMEEIKVELHKIVVLLKEIRVLIDDSIP